MKKLGLIGGTSWHSTIDYYSYINQCVNDHFGDNTNPPLLVFTLNHALIRKHQMNDNWNAIAELITEAAISLEKAGAEMIMFCANTSHKVFDQVESNINTPILHIADATAKAIHAKNLKKVLFIGTKYSMQEDFITQRISNEGIEVIVPERPEQINELQRIIQEELTYGNIIASSKDYLLKLIQSNLELGVEAVILGCTEFPILIQEEDLSIPIFNTTEIHARAGVDFILKEYQ